MWQVNVFLFVTCVKWWLDSLYDRVQESSILYLMETWPHDQTRTPTPSATAFHNILPRSSAQKRKSCGNGWLQADCTERLVVTQLRPSVCPSQDPLEFAYQPHVEVNDAVIYLLQKAFSSLALLSTSCSLTSPVPSTPSSLGCWGPNWRTCRWILPLSHGSITIWQVDNSLRDYRTVCPTPCWCPPEFEES